ncbi:MAG: GNAT family N-acetyltransferase [Acidobacteria bacterium]|nr:GNAT family N-acetyltransferase [Acidobacteriota bacterium]
MRPSLSTPRLTLFPLAESDLGALHALWTDADVRRYLCDDKIVSLEQSRQWLAVSTRGFAERRFGLWGLHDAAGGPLIGFCGCRDWSTGEPELMYGLWPAWWGRGLATEAAQAVLEYVFEVLGHPVMMAATDPPNVASIRVMERLGMVFDWRGEMHGLDTLVYRLSRERWRRHRVVSDNRRP